MFPESPRRFSLQRRVTSLTLNHDRALSQLGICLSRLLLPFGHCAYVNYMYTMRSRVYLITN